MLHVIPAKEAVSQLVNYLFVPCHCEHIEAIPLFPPLVKGDERGIWEIAASPVAPRDDMNKGVILRKPATTEESRLK